MTPTDRCFARLALAGLLVAALGLSACGRKGPLDLPPGAQTAQDSPAQGAPGAPAAAPREQRYDPAGNPVAPRGEKKAFFLDWLLN